MAASQIEIWDVLDRLQIEAHSPRLEHRPSVIFDRSIDVTENYHQGNAESVNANQIVQPKKSALRAEIYEWITSRGRFGATCFEVETSLGLKHQTASARMSEMKIADCDYRIFWNGQKRSTGAATAKVYVTSEGQRS